MRRTEAPSEIPEVDVTLITRRLRMTPTERWVVTKTGFTSRNSWKSRGA